MLSDTNYAQKYAGIIGKALVSSQQKVLEARTGSSMGVRQTLAFSVDVSFKKKKKQRLVYETISLVESLAPTDCGHAHFPRGY